MFESVLFAAEKTAQQPQAGWGTMLFPFVLIFLVFYFIVIRPQKKQQQKVEQMRSALAKGDKVVTIGGIIGTIANIKNNIIVLKVSDNTRIEFRKSAISGKFSDNVETEEISK